MAEFENTQAESIGVTNYDTGEQTAKQTGKQMSEQAARQFGEQTAGQAENQQEESEFFSVRKRLEEIAKAVDDPDLALDDALDLYEEAVSLGLRASDLLDVGISEAEQQAILSEKDSADTYIKVSTDTQMNAPADLQMNAPANTQANTQANTDIAQGQLGTFATPDALEAQAEPAAQQPKQTDY